ncbi:metallophosphoesterase family protein [Mucilaginibacter arboris]|uniref:YfcE family phosphodiesterase n=1 Tax=Mucilaginibacter arboris TaxID=2682090 RepID=A0A7K1SUX8_9SPHI|nr:metallophosphoesterase family protein [Mucilaginibacter arboris]MVN21136.1 YfcE family phosphodiesterase [Mucilaginibacter arboris]
MKTYAVISDIHGNSLALKAVLEDIQLRKVDVIVNLGDHVFGPLEPQKTADLIFGRQMICISGNKDRDILENLDQSTQDETLEQVKKNLDKRSIDWLKSLPSTQSIDRLIFACHGTPESDNAYLLEEVTENGVFVYKDEELVAKTANIKEQIILCGHSHVNRVIWLSNGKIILNPGSVGLPAYLGNAKVRFAMESMTPHAKYALIYAGKNSINIEQINCSYDWNAASETARKNGREDWAQGLLYGRMPKSLKS